MALQITRHYGAEVTYVNRPYNERLVWEYCIPNCDCLPFFEVGTTTIEGVQADGLLLNAMDSEMDVGIHTREGIMLCDPEITSLAELIEVDRYLEEFAKDAFAAGERFKICETFKEIRFRDAFSKVVVAIAHRDFSLLKKTKLGHSRSTIMRPNSKEAP